MDELHRGSCLCGAVTYHVASALKAVTHCHCSQCRKGHGAAFASYASAPRSTLSIDQGVHILKTFHSSEEVARQFCGKCGSSLFWSDSKGDFSDWVSVAIGTLDTPLLIKKHRHVHVESKAPWYPMRDVD